MRNNFQKFHRISLLMSLILILLFPDYIKAQEEDSLFLATIHNLSVSIGGEGYLQGSKPDAHEYADHSYFYKIYVQARSPKGFKN